MNQLTRAEKAAKLEPDCLLCPHLHRPRYLGSVVCRKGDASVLDCHRPIANPELEACKEAE